MAEAKPARTDMLKGTLDLLILRTLRIPAAGIAVADRIRQVTDGTFTVGPGSLFPALHRLEQEGWIRGKWQLTDQGRRARAHVDGRRPPPVAKEASSGLALRWRSVRSSIAAQRSCALWHRTRELGTDAVPAAASPRPRRRARGWVGDARRTPSRPRRRRSLRRNGSRSSRSAASPKFGTLPWRCATAPSSNRPACST